jgi:Zn-dependent peptidase ImmA (M78 family)
MKRQRRRADRIMFEEFVAAENLLEKAGLLDVKLPIPLKAVIEYLSREGLEFHYYNPKQAPGMIADAAYGVDEVLVNQEEGALLFVNASRPLTRQRFSIFHGIGHYILPAHRGLDYLARGCNTMKPITKKPYERQADRFAAGLNMPPTRFRHHMALLPFGMQTVEKLAGRYSASMESAAIHYVELADAPCALIRFERPHRKSGTFTLDSPYKVRYQVSNDRFPFRIKPDTTIQDFPDEILSWECPQGKYLIEGVIRSEHLGLEPGTSFRTYCSHIDVMGGIIALVYPGSKDPEYVIDTSKAI